MCSRMRPGGPAAAGTGLALTLRPVDLRLATFDVAGAEATLTFDRHRASAPPVRLVTAAGSTLSVDGDLTIRVRSGTPMPRLVVTDLTGSPVGSIVPSVLDPTTLIDRHRVGAVVLEQDSLYAGRSARLKSLGFGGGGTFGPDVAFTRPVPPAPG